MKRLLPVLMIALLTSACGGTTPSESPSAEVSPTPATATVIDPRLERYGISDFVESEYGFDWFYEKNVNGAEVSARLSSFFGDSYVYEEGLGFLGGEAADFHEVQVPELPTTFTAFCASPTALSYDWYAGGDSENATWSVRFEAIADGSIFGRPAKGYAWTATGTSEAPGTSEPPGGFADRFGAFYCLRADDLISDALRTKEERGLPLHLVYSVDVWDGEFYTTDERAAIVAKGFAIPTAIATGQPLFVTLAELEQ